MFLQIKDGLRHLFEVVERCPIRITGTFAGAHFLLNINDEVVGAFGRFSFFLSALFRRMFALTGNNRFVIFGSITAPQRIHADIGFLIAAEQGRYFLSLDVVTKSTIGNIINCSYDSVKLRIIHEMCQDLGISIKVLPVIAF